MLQRPRALTTLVVALLAPVWTLLLSGTVQIRACLPAGSAVDAHLMLVRAEPACASGAAMGDGTLTVLGTVGIAALATWLLGTGVLSAVAAVAARCRTLFAALREVTWRRRPRLRTVVSRRVRMLAAARVLDLRDLLDVVALGRRAPPLSA